VIGEFPLALRHGSAVTLFSVGLPTILLAVWARPGAVPAGSFMPRLFHFVLTAVLVTSVLALLLLYGTILLELNRMGTLRPGISPLKMLAMNEAARTTAQSALAIFLVFEGLLLVIFVEPPTRWWVGGNHLSGDLRPTKLAVMLMALFVVVLVTPPLRGLFALVWIGWLPLGAVVVALVIWLFTIRWFWRAHVLTRIFGGRSELRPSTPSRTGATPRRL
jgi:cation-transporting ATPase E